MKLTGKILGIAGLAFLCALFAYFPAFCGGEDWQNDAQTNGPAVVDESCIPACDGLPFDPGASLRAGCGVARRSADRFGGRSGSCYSRPACIKRGLVNCEKRRVQALDSLYSGYFLPDGKGGYIWIGGGPEDRMNLPDQRTEQAREWVLQVRELADQLLAILQGKMTSGILAIPTSFVNLDNFEETSSFGRLLAEQMYYECNKRGIATQEYRMTKEIVVKPQDGEFSITRETDNLRNTVTASCAITGTYYYDMDNVIVNARLFKLESGLVLTSGMIVIPRNRVVSRMLAKRRGLSLKPVEVPIKSYSADSSLGF